MFWLQLLSTKRISNAEYIDEHKEEVKELKASLTKYINRVIPALTTCTECNEGYYPYSNGNQTTCELCNYTNSGCTKCNKSSSWDVKIFSCVYDYSRIMCKFAPCLE